MYRDLVMTRLHTDIRFAKLGDQELMEQLSRLFWYKAEPEPGRCAIELSSLRLPFQHVPSDRRGVTHDVTRHAHELGFLLIPLTAKLAICDHTLRSSDVT
jgi:hypothetical protein